MQVEYFVCKFSYNGFAEVLKTRREIDPDVHYDVTDNGHAVASCYLSIGA